mgnify:CR=1 FL=1
MNRKRITKKATSNKSLIFKSNPPFKFGYIKALFTWSINIDRNAMYFNCAPERTLILSNPFFLNSIVSVINIILSISAFRFLINKYDKLV